LNDLENCGSAVTIGNFDGQHIGHARLFELVKEHAARVGLASLVLSFYPHPAFVLRKDGSQQDFKLITSYAERRRNIEALGFDRFIEHPFTEDFARTEPWVFLKFLSDEMNCRALYIGGDYRFGRDKTGSMEDFSGYADELGIKVNIVPDVEMNGVKVSSTAIKRFIIDKDLAGAASFLGRPYEISGVVRRGFQRGRAIGFPTANIIPPPEKLLPPDGVYETRVSLNGAVYKAMTNIGKNPTFNAVRRTVESHLFGFCQDITGCEINAAFIRFIRDERRFVNADELTEQLKRDAAFISST
jgi:riboflavin kinase/FMN adenylyltransferase